MSCSEIRDDLKAFADGELSVSTRTAVDRHLSDCSDCRGELEEIRRLTTELRAIDTAVPRAELRKRIMAQIPAPVVEPPAVKRSFWKSWWPSSLALAGAAAVCLIIMFGGFGKHDVTPVLDKEDKVALAPESPAPKDDSVVEKERSESADNRPALKPQPKTSAPTTTLAPEHAAKGKAAAAGKQPELHDQIALVEPHGTLARPEAAPRFDLKSADTRLGKKADMLAAQKPAVAGGAPASSLAKDAPTGAAANSAAKASEPARKGGFGDEIDKPKVAFGETGQRGRSQLGLQSTAANAVELTVDKLETGVAHLQEIAKQEGALTKSVTPDAKEKEGKEATYFLYIAPDRVDEVKQRLQAKDTNLLSYRSFAYSPVPEGLEGGQRNLASGGMGAGLGGGFGGFGGGAQGGRAAGGSAANRSEKRGEAQSDGNLKAPAGGARQQSRGLGSDDRESGDAMKKRQNESKSELQDRAYGRAKQGRSAQTDNKPANQQNELAEQNGNSQKLGAIVNNGAAHSLRRDAGTNAQLFKSQQNRAVQEQIAPQRVELMVRIKEQPKPAGKKE